MVVNTDGGAVFSSMRQWMQVFCCLYLLKMEDARGTCVSSLSYLFNNRDHSLQRDHINKDLEHCFGKPSKCHTAAHPSLCASGANLKRGILLTITDIVSLSLFFFVKFSCELLLLKKQHVPKTQYLSDSGSQWVSSEITSQQTSRISVTENFLLWDFSRFSDR